MEARGSKVKGAIGVSVSPFPRAPAASDLWGCGPRRQAPARWPQVLPRATRDEFPLTKDRPRHFFIFKSLPLKVLTIAAIRPSWVS